KNRCTSFRDLRIASLTFSEDQHRFLFTESLRENIKMPLNYDAEIFSQLDRPWDSIARFLSRTLPELGWDRGDQEEVVMDVGCGPGRITLEFILPLFPNLKNIIAIDAVPSMIKLARTLNPHPKIEYSVANFEDRFALKFV
ncbi:methyltransf_25 domain-containing protein, partial [Nephila pilipes]